MNFISKMNTQELLEGYKTVLRNIYEVKPYYQRIRRFLLNYKRPPSKQIRIQFLYLSAFFKSIVIIGMISKGRGEFWKFFIWTLVKCPRSFLDAMIFAVYGYHYLAVFGIGN